MRRFDLVQTFALRSLIVVALMAFALSWAVTQSVERVVVEQAAKTARVTSAVVIGDYLTDAESLEVPLDPDAVHALQHAVEAHLAAEGIVAIKIWNIDGVLAYSTDEEDPIGSSFAEKPAIVLALAGDVVTEVERESEPESALQYSEHGDIIEVYAPLSDSDSEEIIGVFETYEPYSSAATAIRQANLVIIGIIIAGSLIVYVAQIRMVQGAARRLRETEDLVKAVNARLQGSMREVEEHSLGTLQALTVAVDAKDSYTASHALSVTDYAVAIGRRLDLSSDEIVLLERASLLHDIGKIGVPEAILLKPSRLTDDERSIIQDHSEIGAHIIESIPFLQELVPIIRHHHERWDGGGYPAGLIGTDTPRLARVLAVADSFDAMTSDRPYRRGLRVAVARQELMKYRGIQFDPDAVDALFQALDLDEVTVAHHYEAQKNVASA